MFRGYDGTSGFNLNTKIQKHCTALGQEVESLPTHRREKNEERDGCGKGQKQRGMKWTRAKSWVGGMGGGDLAQGKAKQWKTETGIIRGSSSR